MPQVTFIIRGISPSIKHRIAFYLQKNTHLLAYVQFL